MSILDSLLRFVDPIAHRQKQQERRRKRQQLPPGTDDDLEAALPPSPPGRPKTPLTCRVCGYTGGPEHKFCPRCLAETMERRR